MFCNQCGAKNVDESRFCASCGAPISSVSQYASSKRELEPVSSNTESIQEYYEAAIGYKNTDYYLSRFTRFDAEGFGVGWNWPAFFISFYWLLYRKMWAWALLYYLLPLPLGIFNAFLLPASEATAGLGYLAYLAAIFVVFPMYANAIYYRHVTRKIQKAKSYSVDREKRLRMLTAEGGTSGIVLIILLIFIFVMIIGILAAIAIPAYQDFTLRAKVAQGLSLGEEYKRKVETYAAQYNQWPSSNADIGSAQQTGSSNIASVSVEKDGVVVITYANDPHLNGKSVTLVPSLNDESHLVWKCKGIDIENKFLPFACRK